MRVTAEADPQDMANTLQSRQTALSISLRGRTDKLIFCSYFGCYSSKVYDSIVSYIYISQQLSFASQVNFQ